MIDDSRDEWLQTWRGGALPLRDFGASAGANNALIHHTETARVLSGIERFGARTQERYTVAEHSVRVSWCVQDMGGDDRAFAQLQRLGRILGTQALLALLRELLTDLHRSHGLDFGGGDGVHCRVSGL